MIFYKQTCFFVLISLLAICDKEMISVAMSVSSLTRSRVSLSCGEMSGEGRVDSW